MSESFIHACRLKAGEHLKKTIKQLVTARHKGGLVLILAFGFLITLPIWLLSTPDEKQRVSQSTTTMRVLEHHVGLIDITPDERNHFRSLLTQEVQPPSTEPKRDMWVDKVSLNIIPFGKSDHEAKAIARWVWIYAQRHGLDPALILALITIESRFDSFATSSVGAQGLMQVMPFWKKELGSNKDNLFDVATNIRYGCAILRHYLNRYKTPSRALAAYNGSLGRNKYPDKVASQLNRFR